MIFIHRLDGLAGGFWAERSYKEEVDRENYSANPVIRPALGLRQLRNGKRADMGGNHQQLYVVHADDEFATDRTD